MRLGDRNSRKHQDSRWALCPADTRSPLPEARGPHGLRRRLACGARSGMPFLCFQGYLINQLPHLVFDTRYSTRTVERLFQGGGHRRVFFDILPVVASLGCLLRGSASLLDFPQDESGWFLALIWPSSPPRPGFQGRGGAAPHHALHPHSIALVTGITLINPSPTGNYSGGDPVPSDRPRYCLPSHGVRLHAPESIDFHGK